MRQEVEEVIQAYGGVKAVQEAFNFTEPMAVYNWRRRGIPVDKVEVIHRKTGIPVARLMGFEENEKPE